MREGIPLEKGRFYVIESDWSTKGAQEFPLGVVHVGSEMIDTALTSANVVFVGGSAENNIVCFFT